jgi:hypothetical protein
LQGLVERGWLGGADKVVSACEDLKLGARDGVSQVVGTEPGQPGALVADHDQRRRGDGRHGRVADRAELLVLAHAGVEVGVGHPPRRQLGARRAVVGAGPHVEVGGDGRGHVAAGAGRLARG